MLLKITQRLAFGLIFALTFGMLAGILSAQASDFWQQPTADDCQNCHGIIYTAWEENAHGKSGVGCLTCHGPIPSDHPETVMPTDVSSRKCSTCHSETYEEWTTSSHGREDLTCVRCHNTHTTSLKTDSVQELCQNCHTDLVHFFSYSAHANAGLLCTDCHLKEINEAERGSPGNRSHTFKVDLESCTNCHQEDMHDPHRSNPCTPEEQTMAEELGLDYPCDPTELAQAGLGLPADQNVLAVEPQTVSPVGFAILGTIIGVAAGIILAPWLEKQFRRAQL